MPAVALATCAPLGEGDADDRVLPAMLAAEGLEASFAVWDDPQVDWGAFDLVVVRSTWDYTERREEFLAWAASVPRILNPVSVLSWNSDKRYLADLAAYGVPVVPTTFVAPGSPLPGDGGEIVVKPTVSAGARDTGRFGPGDRAAALRLLHRLHVAGRTAMVQPYLGAVDEHGESALLYFAGTYSHAVRKAAILRSGESAPLDEEAPGLSAATAMFAKESITPREPTMLQRRVAERTLQAIEARLRTRLLYARIDLLDRGDGVPVLLEAELTEPSLFLGQDAPRAARFARAVAAFLPASRLKTK